MTTLQVEVFLTGAQVADPQLSSALTAFRRAANIVARLEDEIVFKGQPGPGTRPTLLQSITRWPVRRRPATASREMVGKLRGDSRRTGCLAPSWHLLVRLRARQVGDALVGMVSKAIGRLERAHYFGPFACVLSDDYFKMVQTPQPGSIVLPQERILPFLGGGALLRTSTLPDDVGLVIALGGELIDLVVGTDISVKFLQATLEPRFVFRVYEKIVLRVKEPCNRSSAHLSGNRVIQDTRTNRKKQD